MICITRQTLSFVCCVLAIFALQAKAQTTHTLDQQSQMKSEAELSQEEQRVLELERVESICQFLAVDEDAIEREVKAGKVRRRTLNSKVLHISENEADLIRIILEQTWVRLRTLESRRASESLRGLSMEERADRRRRFDEEKLRICEETLNSLKQQLGSEDFEKFDVFLRRHYPWSPPRILRPAEASKSQRVEPQPEQTKVQP